MMGAPFRISSAVEQRTVNPLVAGSNPASGVESPLMTRGLLFLGT